MFAVNLSPMDYKCFSWRNISAFIRTKNYRKAFTESKVIWILVETKIILGGSENYSKILKITIEIINIFDFSKILENRKIENVNDFNCGISGFLKNVRSKNFPDLKILNLRFLQEKIFFNFRGFST